MACYDNNNDDDDDDDDDDSLFKRIILYILQVKILQI